MLHTRLITGNIVCLLLFLNISILSAQEWQTTTVYNGNCLYLSIAVDSEGNPHISYTEHIAYGNRPLKYAKWNGSYWDISTVYDHVGDVGGYTSIAIDEQDNPHISFYGQIMLKYAHWDGSTWQVETVDSSPDEAIGLYSSIALDSEGNPHFSYLSTWTLDPWNLKYAYWDGSDWQIQILDTFDGWMYDVNNSLVLDSDDNPHIAYNNGYNGVDLMYVFWDGTNWQFEFVDTEGETGVNPSIALDINDIPHIAFYNRTSGQLRYASRINSEWEVSSLDYMGGGVMETNSAISLDFDSDNFPNIAYNNENLNLMYAYWDGSSWATEIACDIAYSGYYASLAIDSGNNRHIAHYEWYYGTLYYTYYENPLSSENDILTFTVPEQVGETEINFAEHTVNLNVETGTNLTALTPTITISENATIDPESGIPQDFTNPFEYTVTAENGGQQIWVVTVLVATRIEEIDNIYSIYPNPTTGIVNLTGFRNLLGLEITDITGKIILTMEFASLQSTPPLQMDISSTMGHAPLQGIYFIKITTEKDIFTEKLIIQ